MKNEGVIEPEWYSLWPEGGVDVPHVLRLLPALGPGRGIGRWGMPVGRQGTPGGCRGIWRRRVLNWRRGI
jgi:hypothetical protein